MNHCLRAIIGVFATVIITGMNISSAQAQNLPPVVTDIGDITLSENEIHIFDGSSSFDPEGGALVYDWHQLSGPSMSVGATDSSVLITVMPTLGGVGGTIVMELTVTDDQGLSSSDIFSINIRSQNHPPVAMITGPDTVQGGSLVTLDGSNSYDLDGDLLTYDWSVTSGQNVVFDLSDPTKPTFYAPDVVSSETVIILLSVSDGQALTGSSITIQITAANHAPVANAGFSQTVVFNDSVTLDGTGSFDTDGNPLTFSWTQTGGTSVVLSDAHSATPTFIAPKKKTNLIFSLVVNDGSLDSVVATVKITVLAPNAKPNCTFARGNKSNLWPPNHSMARIKIRGLENEKYKYVNDGGDDGEGDGDSDDLDKVNSNIQIRVTKVLQDEPTSGLSPEDVAIDAIVKANYENGKPRVQDLVLLRREQNPKGDGRLYQISFTATNLRSNLSCNGKINVCVPTRPGKNGKCINSGLKYLATK